MGRCVLYYSLSVECNRARVEDKSVAVTSAAAGPTRRTTAVYDVELGPYFVSLYWRYSRISQRLVCFGTGVVGVLTW